MPGKAVCDKIKDPKKRARCKAYKGEFAKKSSPKPGSPYPTPKPKPPIY